MKIDLGEFRECEAWINENGEEHFFYMHSDGGSCDIYHFVNTIFLVPKTSYFCVKIIKLNLKFAIWESIIYTFSKTLSLNKN